MTDKEFEEKYGRPPVKPGEHVKVKVYWDRIIIALILLILLIIGVVKIISAIVGAFKGDDGKDASSAAPAAVSSVEESSSEQEVNANAQKLGYNLKVCIDPGHGGEDGGAQNAEGTRFEKDDTLRLGLKVRDALEAKGINVVMTRDTDVLLALSEICQIANDADADLFVSLHRNSSEPEYKGIEIWVNNHEPEADTLLASNILSALDRVGITENRNVNFGFIGEPQSNYQVNRCTHMPSCLCEMGFITNDEDNKAFDDNLEAYAQAIADAVEKTAKELGITDENGQRLIDYPYLSTKPQWDEATQSYTTSDGTTVKSADDLSPVPADDNGGEQ